MHNNSSQNREFHQKNVLRLDVHRLFVLALTPLFPWSKCSLRARVHDLWWRVLGHELEALSSGFSEGPVQRQTCLTARRWNVFLHSFKRTFPSRFISGIGCQEEMSATALQNPDLISEVRRPQIEKRAAMQRRQRWKRNSCPGTVWDLIGLAGSRVRLGLL